MKPITLTRYLRRTLLSICETLRMGGVGDSDARSGAAKPERIVSDANQYREFRTMSLEIGP